MRYQPEPKMNKLEALRIAYQFTSQVIPNYTLDKKAEKIGHTLKNEDLQCNDIVFLEDYTTTHIIENYKNMFDFGNMDKRYVLVINHPEYGLVCILSLASVHSCIVMSERPDYLQTDDFIIGINHISKQKFEIYNTITAIDKLYDKGYMQLQLVYGYNNDPRKRQRLHIVCKSDAEIPLYNANKEMRYYNLQDKINQPNVPKEQINKEKLNIIGIKYILNESLYVEYNKLMFQIIEVDIYWVQTQKL